MLKRIFRLFKLFKQEAWGAVVLSIIVTLSLLNSTFSQWAMTICGGLGILTALKPIVIGYFAEKRMDGFLKGGKNGGL